jgi:hypothetical protein
MDANNGTFNGASNGSGNASNGNGNYSLKFVLEDHFALKPLGSYVVEMP